MRELKAAEEKLAAAEVEEAAARLVLVRAARLVVQLRKLQPSQVAVLLAESKEEMQQEIEELGSLRLAECAESTAAMEESFARRFVTAARNDLEHARGHVTSARARQARDLEYVAEYEKRQAESAERLRGFEREEEEARAESVVIQASNEKLKQRLLESKSKLQVMQLELTYGQWA